MTISNLINRTYSNLRWRIALHILFWILMFLSYYYFNTISFNPAAGTPAALWLAVKNAVEFALAFYLLMYIIWPKLLLRRRWIASIPALLAWVMLLALLDGWADKIIFFKCYNCLQRLQLTYPDYYNFLRNNLAYIVFIRVVTGGFIYHLLIQLGFPIALKFARGYFKKTVEQLELAKENLQLEFNFLRAQVNPHFLFNTLNNTYALVMNDRKQQAADSIARLSGLMRYTLHESNTSLLPLEGEVQLLKDYVELEKLRLNDTAVNFYYEADREDYLLPPLLLMPALENAFTYLKDEKGTSIDVQIVAREGKLDVKITNQFNQLRAAGSGGIGLNNLRRRLQSYFGKTASFTTTVANDVYLFQLNCPLS